MKKSLKTAELGSSIYMANKRKIIENLVKIIKNLDIQDAFLFTDK